MLTLIIILSITGTLALVLEVFLPGGILGIAGGLSIIGAVALALGSPSLPLTSTPGRIGLALAIVFSSGAAFLLTLKYFNRTRFGKLLTLESVDRGQASSLHAEVAIGTEATASTDLRPLGTIVAGGKTLEALSESGWIPNGATVRITRIESGSIYVAQT